MLGKLTREEMEDLLTDSAIGRIGCSNNGKIYVVPVNYVYDNGYIIVHGQEGQKVEWMRQNPLVCFEVDKIADNTSWRSVIVQGVYEEITEELDRYEAMQLFVSRMLKLKVSATAVSPESGEERKSDGTAIPKMVIFRIAVKEMSGRFEQG